MKQTKPKRRFSKGLFPNHRILSALLIGTVVAVAVLFVPLVYAAIKNSSKPTSTRPTTNSTTTVKPAPAPSTTPATTTKTVAPAPKTSSANCAQLNSTDQAILNSASQGTYELYLYKKDSANSNSSLSDDARKNTIDLAYQSYLGSINYNELSYSASIRAAGCTATIKAPVQPR